MIRWVWKVSILIMMSASSTKSSNDIRLEKNPSNLPSTTIPDNILQDSSSGIGLDKPTANSATASNARSDRKDELPAAAESLDVSRNKRCNDRDKNVQSKNRALVRVAKRNDFVKRRLQKASKQLNELEDKARYEAKERLINTLANNEIDDYDSDSDDTNPAPYMYNLLASTEKQTKRSIHKEAGDKTEARRATRSTIPPGERSRDAAKWKSPHRQFETLTEYLRFVQNQHKKTQDTSQGKLRTLLQPNESLQLAANPIQRQHLPSYKYNEGYSKVGLKDWQLQGGWNVPIKQRGNLNYPHESPSQVYQKDNENSINPQIVLPNYEPLNGVNYQSQPLVYSGVHPDSKATSTSIVGLTSNPQNVAHHNMPQDYNGYSQAQWPTATNTQHVRIPPFIPPSSSEDNPTPQLPATSQQLNKNHVPFSAPASHKSQDDLIDNQRFQHVGQQINNQQAQPLQGNVGIPEPTSYLNDNENLGIPVPVPENIKLESQVIAEPNNFRQSLTYQGAHAYGNGQAKDTTSNRNHGDSGNYGQSIGQAEDTTSNHNDYQLGNYEQSVGRTHDTSNQNHDLPRTYGHSVGQAEDKTSKQNHDLSGPYGHSVVQAQDTTSNQNHDVTRTYGHSVGQGQDKISKQNHDLSGPYGHSVGQAQDTTSNQNLDLSRINGHRHSVDQAEDTTSNQNDYQSGNYGHSVGQTHHTTSNQNHDSPRTYGHIVGQAQDTTSNQNYYQSGKYGHSVGQTHDTTSNQNHDASKTYGHSVVQAKDITSKQNHDLSGTHGHSFGQAQDTTSNQNHDVPRTYGHSVGQAQDTTSNQNHDVPRTYGHSVGEAEDTTSNQNYHQSGNYGHSVGQAQDATSNQTHDISRTYGHSVGQAEDITSKQNHYLSGTYGHTVGQGQDAFSSQNRDRSGTYRHVVSQAESTLQSKQIDNHSGTYSQSIGQAQNTIANQNYDDSGKLQGFHQAQDDFSTQNSDHSGIYTQVGAANAQAQGTLRSHIQDHSGKYGEFTSAITGDHQIESHQVLPTSNILSQADTYPDENEGNPNFPQLASSKPSIISGNSFGMEPTNHNSNDGDDSSENGSIQDLLPHIHISTITIPEDFDHHNQRGDPQLGDSARTGTNIQRKSVTQDLSSSVLALPQPNPNDDDLISVVPVFSHKVVESDINPTTSNSSPYIRQHGETVSSRFMFSKPTNPSHGNHADNTAQTVPKSHLPFAFNQPEIVSQISLSDIHQSNKSEVELNHDTSMKSEVIDENYTTIMPLQKNHEEIKQQDDVSNNQQNKKSFQGLGRQIENIDEMSKNERLGQNKQISLRKYNKESDSSVIEPENQQTNQGYYSTPNLESLHNQYDIFQNGVLQYPSEQHLQQKNEQQNKHGVHPENKYQTPAEENPRENLEPNGNGISILANSHRKQEQNAGIIQLQNTSPQMKYYNGILHPEYKDQPPAEENPREDTNLETKQNVNGLAYFHKEQNAGINQLQNTENSGKHETSHDREGKLTVEDTATSHLILPKRGQDMGVVKSHEHYDRNTATEHSTHSIKYKIEAEQVNSQKLETQNSSKINHREQKYEKANEHEDTSGNQDLLGVPSFTAKIQNTHSNSGQHDTVPAYRGGAKEDQPLSPVPPNKLDDSASSLEPNHDHNEGLDSNTAQLGLEQKQRFASHQKLKNHTLPEYNKKGSHIVDERDHGSYEDQMKNSEVPAQLSGAGVEDQKPTIVKQGQELSSNHECLHACLHHNKNEVFDTENSQSNVAQKDPLVQTSQKIPSPTWVKNSQNESTGESKDENVIEGLTNMQLFNKYQGEEGGSIPGRKQNSQEESGEVSHGTFDLFHTQDPAQGTLEKHMPDAPIPLTGTGGVEYRSHDHGFETDIHELKSQGGLVNSNADETTMPQKEETPKLPTNTPNSRITDDKAAMLSAVKHEQYQQPHTLNETQKEDSLPTGEEIKPPKSYSLAEEVHPSHYLRHKTLVDDIYDKELSNPEEKAANYYGDSSGHQDFKGKTEIDTGKSHHSEIMRHVEGNLSQEHANNFPENNLKKPVLKLFVKEKLVNPQQPLIQHTVTMEGEKGEREDSSYRLVVEAGPGTESTINKEDDATTIPPEQQLLADLEKSSEAHLNHLKENVNAINIILNHTRLESGKEHFNSNDGNIADALHKWEFGIQNRKKGTPEKNQKVVGEEPLKPMWNIKRTKNLKNLKKGQGTGSSDTSNESEPEKIVNPKYSFRNKEKVFESNWKKSGIRLNNPLFGIKSLGNISSGNNTRHKTIFGAKDSSLQRTFNLPAPNLENYINDELAKSAPDASSDTDEYEEENLDVSREFEANQGGKEEDQANPWKSFFPILNKNSPLLGVNKLNMTRPFRIRIPTFPHTARQKNGSTLRNQETAFNIPSAPAGQSKAITATKNHSKSGTDESFINITPKTIVSSVELEQQRKYSKADTLPSDEEILVKETKPKSNLAGNKMIPTPSPPLLAKPNWHIEPTDEEPSLLLAKSNWQIEPKAANPWNSPSDVQDSVNLAPSNLLHTDSLEENSHSPAGSQENLKTSKIHSDTKRSCSCSDSANSLSQGANYPVLPNKDHSSGLNKGFNINEAYVPHATPVTGLDDLKARIEAARRGRVGQVADETSGSIDRLPARKESTFVEKSSLPGCGCNSNRVESTEEVASPNHIHGSHTCSCNTRTGKDCQQDTLRLAPVKPELNKYDIMHNMILWLKRYAPSQPV